MINHSFIKKKLKELLIKYYQETGADAHNRQSFDLLLECVFHSKKMILKNKL